MNSKWNRPHGVDITLTRFSFLLWTALLPVPGQAADYLELLDFQLIDGTGAAPRAVERLVARDGVIAAIDDLGTAGEQAPGDTWQRISLAGAWVIPGLVDTHVHVARFPDARARAERILRGAVRGGVTSVLDLGGDARALADVERALARGEFSGPTLVFSAMFGGPGIFIGGPTTQLAYGRPPGDAPWTRAVDGDTELPLAIAQAKGAGAGNIKLYGNMTAALAARVIAEAHRQGLRTTAHATLFPARPGELVEAGINILSHAPYLVWEAVETVPDDYGARISGPWSEIPADHPDLLALYRAMAERGVALDATLFVYRAMQDYSPHVQADWAPDAFAWGAQAVRHAHAAGVTITTGTDWFEPRNEYAPPNTHTELQLLVEHAGLTPMDAIVAATRNGAAAIGLEARRGTVEVGKAADLLVLEASPLEDIRNTAKIRMTIKDGRSVSPRP